MHGAWVVHYSTVPDLRPWGCLEQEGDEVVVGGVAASLYSFGQGQELLWDFLVGLSFRTLFLLMSLGFVVLMGIRESLGLLVLMLCCWWLGPILLTWTDPGSLDFRKVYCCCFRPFSLVFWFSFVLGTLVGRRNLMLSTNSYSSGSSYGR
jgi:hypothetical protein